MVGFDFLILGAFAMVYLGSLNRVVRRLGRFTLRLDDVRVDDVVSTWAIACSIQKNGNSMKYTIPNISHP